MVTKGTVAAMVIHFRRGAPPGVARVSAIRKFQSAVRTYLATARLRRNDRMHRSVRRFWRGRKGSRVYRR